MELQEFITKAREHGMNDEQIRHKLNEAGWDSSDVDQALNDSSSDLDVPAPPPHHGHAQATASHPIHDNANSQHGHQPVAVVENLSPRGFEFKIFSVSLIVALYGLLYLINTLIYGEEGGRAFPLTVLIVTAPIAVFMFLRLQRAEKTDPNFALDPSRRKSVQAIQLLTFLALVGHTIFYVYMFVSGEYTADSDSSSYSSYNSYYEEDRPSILQNTMSWIVTMVIAGSVFLYYWRQEHKKR